MGTVIVSGLLAVLVGSIIAKMIRDKKQGKSCCSGNCGHCSHCRH